MNIKNNKGITLVALVTTIVIILILSGITVQKGSEMLRASKLQNITTDLLMIEAKVKAIAEENRFDPTNKLLLGTKLSDVTDTVIQEAAENAGASNFDEWYYVSSSDLQSMGLGALDEKYYLVKYIDISSGTISVDVINVQGYKHSDGNRYYKLSEMENLL